eukprot:scaffold48172_cov26-Tisochrysis_lutea.AAC.1
MARVTSTCTPGPPLGPQPHISCRNPKRITLVQLAATSCEDAKAALALEPNNDYAHHLMGRWHYGASR